jgi:hypothetical protein
MTIKQKDNCVKRSTYFISFLCCTLNTTRYPVPRTFPLCLMYLKTITKSTYVYIKLLLHLLSYFLNFLVVLIFSCVIACFFEFLFTLLRSLSHNWNTNAADITSLLLSLQISWRWIQKTPPNRWYLTFWHRSFTFKF